MGVPQVDQCEWLWQISSIVLLLRPAECAQVTVVGRMHVTLCVLCTAFEIISYDVHMPLKAYG